MFISAHELSYRYPDSTVYALEGFSASFGVGWTGIVGDNGAGKSTLLRIICGNLKPEAGTMVPQSFGIYCEQSTEAPPDGMEDFALDYSSNAVRLRSSLEIDDAWFWRYDSLSPGERKRIQIACAVHLSPPILALDEPTNHLDADTRKIVLKALQCYEGIGLLVSHDRIFLDELVYQCIFLRKGKGHPIPGCYSEAKKQLAIQQKTVIAERKNAKDTLSRIKKESQRRQAEASRATSRRSGKHLDKHDSDGREKLRLAVYSGQDGKAGRLSSQMDKKMEAAQNQLEKTHIEKSYHKPLELISEAAKRKVLLNIDAGEMPLDDERVLHYPDLHIGNTDHVGLQGRNGFGKSTFLNHLLKDKEFDSKLVYIPQEMTAEESRDLLKRVKSLSQAERGQLLSIVARLNSPPERILSGDELSPGELRKLMLAEGLMKQPHLIVMDEPTNHLDIHSIETLQEVLSTCCCALILVSHDERFLDALTDIRWIFDYPSVKKANESSESPEDNELVSDSDLEEDVLDYSQIILKVVLT